MTHLVQLPNEKPMQSVMGIKVSSWDEFCNMNLEDSKYRFIICSGDARAAEKLMEQAGFKNYYIFWADRERMLYVNQPFVWKQIRENLK